ncbi:hypothetical protein M9434_001050 [Picochlorum sp. BPE23]|nr:hypothetical protein M9434_001050 [Picochlorum sp. BPE23]
MAQADASMAQPAKPLSRVEQLQAAYKERDTNKTKSSNYKWRWYGRWWDREEFKLEPLVFKECYCENGSQLIQDDVLHNWRLLDTSEPVPQETRLYCAYHTVIESLCGKIRHFGPFPRSKPTYYVAAARHPIGVVLHGQKLRTGESLQLVPKIEYNTPIWMFIGACIQKILVLVEREEPTRKGGDGHRRWMEFIKGIRETLDLLHMKGLTNVLPVESITEEQIKEANEYLAADSAVGDVEKAIITDIHTVFCGALPKNRQHGQVVENGEYMAHVPHMFEWYLRQTVCDILGQQTKYEVVDKQGFRYPRRENYGNEVYPDIVIRSKKGANENWVACIDAKLKNSNEKDKCDMHQMAIYAEALERDNARRKCQGSGVIVKGVIFVAVYGENPGTDDIHDKTPEDGEIRFMFCHLHKRPFKEVDSNLKLTVEDSLKFLGVVKGGKQLRFRAVVVVGNENGTVGVGCASAKEVVMAVQKAAVDAKRNLVTVPLSKSYSFPHRFDGVFGAARVMLRPAAEGTGVIAGGAVRAVLELAGVKNGFGKQLGSDNALNNAKATVEGLKAMRTFKDVARERGLPLEHFLPSV